MGPIIIQILSKYVAKCFSLLVEDQKFVSGMKSIHFYVCFSSPAELAKAHYNSKFKGDRPLLNFENKSM